MNILSQNFRNVLKNRLENKIKCITSVFIEELLSSLTNGGIGYNNYLNLISEANRVSIELAKKIIIEVIKEYDDYYRDSAERKREYYVNKKNVPRTITTIIGELTFTRTYYQSKIDGKYYFYIDELLNLPQYDHYDPIVKGLAVKETFYTNQAQAGRIVGERIVDVANLTNKNTEVFSIPRQSINNWLKDWNVDIAYDKCKTTPKTLYIMADEKFIGCQDLDGDIMGKAFVVFEGVKQISKGRRALINRHIFTFYSKKPWQDLLDKLVEIYDYDEIENIYVLSDGGNWLTAGMHELKVESFQKVTHLLCLFHYKQAINHITTVKEERIELFTSFLNDKRKKYKNNLNAFIEKYPHKKDTIERKIKYLLKHYRAAKHIVSSSIGSSMESHISHFVASTFASRPKGYSVNNIGKYFMLNDAKTNGINLFNYYLQTYDYKKEEVTYKESNNYVSALKKKVVINSIIMPYLENSNSTRAYKALYNISRIDNEIRAL